MKSILLIDDDEQITDVLGVVLESQGYSIQSCSTPGAAIEMIRRTTFSVVLLDLRLGEFSGLDLLPNLREIYPDVPIFIITAHGDVDSAVAALTQGADGYIRKPFEEGALKDQIARAIENYELRRALRAMSLEQAARGGFPFLSGAVLRRRQLPQVLERLLDLHQERRVQESDDRHCVGR